MSMDTYAQFMESTLKVPATRMNDILAEGGVLPLPGGRWGRWTGRRWGASTALTICIVVSRCCQRQ